MNNPMLPGAAGNIDVLKNRHQLVCQRPNKPFRKEILTATMKKCQQN